jgi:hypothetical protein
MVNRARRFAALALVAASAAAVVASAGNLSFLADTPLNHFSPQDMDLMRANAQKALDGTQGNARQSWANDRTGASGWAQVRGEFKATNGTPCKRLRVVNQVKGLMSDATYTVCRSPDNGWIFNADARPAQ